MYVKKTFNIHPFTSFYSMFCSSTTFIDCSKSVLLENHETKFPSLYVKDVRCEKLGGKLTCLIRYFGDIQMKVFSVLFLLFCSMYLNFQ